MMKMQFSDVRKLGHRVGFAFCGWLIVAVLSGPVQAQNAVPELDEEAEKTLDLVDEDFDDALKDLGELAGEVFVCASDEADIEKHEGRVEAIYSELIRLFGSERAFIFAAYYGYGTASDLSKDVCAEQTDEFEDQYGAIAEKYDLID